MDKNSMADIELVTPAAIVRSSIDYVIDENDNNVIDSATIEAEQRKGLLDDSDSEEEPDSSPNPTHLRTRTSARCPSTPGACFTALSTSLPFRVLIIVAIIAVITLQPGTTISPMKPNRSLSQSTYYERLTHSLLTSLSSCRGES